MKNTNNSNEKAEMKKEGGVPFQTIKF